MRPETEVLESPSGLTIYHKGPSLGLGPLPSIFYFAATGRESLDLNPFNELVLFLENDPIHIFSFTIPGHGQDLTPSEVMSFWADEMAHDRNPIDEFLQQSLSSIEYLIEKEYSDPNRLATAGLSRGGFLATHLAACDPRLRIILGFAPITQLAALGEFKELNHHMVSSLSLTSIKDKLIDKKLRYYIGNRDLKVGTQECFQFVHDLTETAYAKGFRSPQAELIITPSIGHKGHGTPLSSFHDGAEWLRKQLENKH